MQFGSLFSMLAHIPLIAGVEISLLPGQDLNIRTALVKRKWNTVTFEGGEYQLGSFEEIRKKIPLGTPLAVSLIGRGIIHRQVEDGNEEGNGNILKKIIPNASAADFCIQEVKTKKGRLVSLIKKADMERLVSEIRQVGLTLLSLSLGPFALLPLIPLIGDPGSQSAIQLNQHRFTFENGDLVDYAFASEEERMYSKIRLADTELDERLFPAFANAFCLIGDMAFAQLAVPGIRVNREEFKARLQFKRSGMALLGIFLLVLLLNTMVFMSLSKKLAVAGKDDFLNKKMALERLKENIRASEEVFDSVNLHRGNSRAMVAHMADELAACMPAELILDELLFFPKSTARNNNRQPVYAFNTIQIKGRSGDVQSLNNWVAHIGSLSFCKEVSIKNYSMEEGKEGYFLVLINI